MPGPLARYRQLQETGAFSEDPQQADVVQALEILYHRITFYRGFIGRCARMWYRCWQRPLQPAGLYIWGGVGRGKTCLMDLFFESLTGTRQRRWHYHHFMQHVHSELTTLQGQRYPLRTVARRLAQRADVVCFDEFFVTDITDAMLLGTLLEELLRVQVWLVMTSNSAPDSLYENGLQRSRFLPAIMLLKRHMRVLHLASPTDYRLASLLTTAVCFVGPPKTHLTYLRARFQQLTKSSAQAGHITLMQRSLETVGCANDSVWFTLDTICGGPRSSLDYIELAKCYHTVFISHIDVLQHDDMARRFIALIDELYDRRVKLLLQTQVALVALYPRGALLDAFQRTLSRLTHMQSEDYLATPHIP